MTEYNCLKCGHKWIRKKAGEPTQCLKCKNRKFNSPLIRGAGRPKLIKNDEQTTGQQ